MRKLRKEIKGVTMVALVVTIIVLLIVSSVVISLTVGNNGLFERSKKSGEEYIKKEAEEAMNIKITSTQIKTYTESQRMPNLQELADDLCEDEEMEYVLLESKKEASLDKIDVSGSKSIYTKIKKYPYEFEIDEKLRLASIDGIKIAESENEIVISKEEYERLIKDNEELAKNNEELSKNNEELLKIKEEYENMKNSERKLLGVFSGWKQSADWNDAGFIVYTGIDNDMCTLGGGKITIKEKRKIYDLYVFYKCWS